MSEKRVIAFDVKLTHSTVCGDKLLYGHVPDPFPQCGHARLISTSILTHMVVQVPGISAGNDQCTTGLICHHKKKLMHLGQLRPENRGEHPAV